MIHRDIRPSNILIDENGQVLLCDFSISTDLIDSVAFTKESGVQFYLSPERLKGSIQGTSDGYDIRADVYALGLTLIELAIGEHPYKIAKLNNPLSIAEHVLKRESPTIPLPNRSYFSPEFIDIVDQMLLKDVNKRPKYWKGVLIF